MIFETIISGEKIDVALSSVSDFYFALTMRNSNFILTAMSTAVKNRTSPECGKQIKAGDLCRFILVLDLKKCRITARNPISDPMTCFIPWGEGGWGGEAQVLTSSRPQKETQSRRCSACPCCLVRIWIRQAVLRLQPCGSFLSHAIGCARLPVSVHSVPISSAVKHPQFSSWREDRTEGNTQQFHATILASVLRKIFLIS